VFLLHNATNLSLLMSSPHLAYSVGGAELDAALLTGRRTRRFCTGVPLLPWSLCEGIIGGFLRKGAPHIKEYKKQKGEENKRILQVLDMTAHSASAAK
jgi:hypothetical protein